MTFPICQCKGTVFIKIWWQILFVAIYSCGFVLAHKHSGFKVTIPWTLVPILGVATGMLLVFRTNTAYDRYWEARKLWSSMTTSIRNLTRNIWVGVKEPEEEGSRILVEKVSILNILAAFSYATRNYLRAEYSYEDADLKYLLRHVPKFYNIDCKCSRKRRKSKKDSLTEEMEGVGCSMICRTCYTTKKYKFTAYDEETPTNIPMELSYLLGAYIKNSNQKNLIDPSLLAALNNALNSLVDCLTGFERILRTPIPLAYSHHLHHATWIYILTLPPQLVAAIEWFTPAAVSLAAFCLLGVLEIGWEIENPFGRDSNDLPLDDFCRVTHREIQRMMGRKIPSTDVWLMSPANRPLAPDCAMNAPELARLPPEDLRSLMKRDPIQMRKYFENLAFTPDNDTEASSENTKMTKTDTPSSSTQTSPSPSTSQPKLSTSKVNVDISTPPSPFSKEEDNETEEIEEELSSKRVSFVLPDDEEEEEEEEISEEKVVSGEIAEEEEAADDADEEDEEEDCKEEELAKSDNNVKGDKNSTEKTEEKK